MLCSTVNKLNAYGLVFCSTSSVCRYPWSVLFLGMPLLIYSEANLSVCKMPYMFLGLLMESCPYQRTVCNSKTEHCSSSQNTSVLLLHMYALSGVRAGEHSMFETVRYICIQRERERKLAVGNPVLWVRNIAVPLCLLELLLFIYV